MFYNKGTFIDLVKINEKKVQAPSKQGVARKTHNQCGEQLTYRH
jgi:hypothetical protein